MAENKNKINYNLRRHFKNLGRKLQGRNEKVGKQFFDFCFCKEYHPL